MATDYEPGCNRRLPTFRPLPITLALLSFLLSAQPLHAQETVDPRSGRLLLTATDLVLPAGPITLGLSRTLDTQRTDRGLLGTRWRLNWESRVVPRGPLMLLEEVPYPVAFTASGTTPGYAAVTGDRLSIERDGRMVRTKLDGTSETFDVQGRLVERDYRNGNKEIVRYGADGRIARIDGPRGTFIQFSADPQGQVTRIETSTGASVRYAYIGDNLTEVQVNGRPVVRYSYDARGALTRIDRPRTGAVDIAYDANQRVVSRRWADGAEERFDYDDTAHALRRIDPTGAVTITQWTADGRRAQVIEPRGGKIAIAFDAAGRPESVTDQTGASTKLVYDPLGRAAALQDAYGQITRYEYVGATGRVRTITRADGTQESFAYDSQMNPTEIKIGAQTLAEAAYNSDGTVSVAKVRGVPQQRLAYDAQGRLQASVNALGEQLQVSYDARGNPVRAIDAIGGAWAWQWNAQDQLASATDPVGAITRYEYDSSSRLARITGPLGGVARFEYDVRGRLVAETDPSGQQTRYEYDRAGRLAKASIGSASESFRYDPAGNLIEWVDRLGRTVQMDYDALGRITQERWSTGLQVHYRYDARGQLIAIADSSGRTLEWQHDARGRIIAQRDALGAVTQFQYDGLGNVTARRDPRGYVKQFAYTADGSLARVQEPSGDAAEYRYDAAYRLVEMVRPSGGRSRFTYNGLGYLTQEIDPLGHERRYQYDAAGRLVASTDAMGHTTRYAYDAAGRLTEKRFADGKRVTFKYDAVGNLIEADDGAFALRYAYDAAGRRVKAEYPAVKKAVAYEYDTAGLRTKLIAPDGRVTRYEYDGHKQLSAIVPADGKRIGLSYDAQQRLQSIAYPNGVTGKWQYDGAGRVTKLDYADAAGKAIAAWTYSYDPDGNLLKQQTADGRNTSYGYDPAGQLTEVAGSAGVVRYRYGRGGARAAIEAGPRIINYRNDAADRLIEAGPETLSYDANGNLVRREGPAGTTSYEYDAEDRLVKVQASDGKTTTFGYAPTGERVWKRDEGGLTYYIYDGIDLIEETDERGNLKASYAHGPGIDQPLTMLREGKAYYYHADRLGSARALTDEHGNVVAAYDYDAHGKIETARGAVPNPFAFTGREWDASTQLYYYRTRYYDPTLGQFLSPDWRPAALDEPLQHNPYVYARNQPLRFVDPLGLAPNNPYAGASTDELLQRKGILDEKLQRTRAAQSTLIDRPNEIFGNTTREDPGPMRGLYGTFDKARSDRLDQMGAKIDAARQPIQAELNRRGYVPPPPPAEPELTASDRRWLNRWLAGQGEDPLPSSSSRATGKVQAISPETAQAPRPVAPAQTGAAVAEAEAGAAVAASEAGAASRLKGLMPGKGTVAVVVVTTILNAGVAAAQAEPGQRLEAAGDALKASGRGLLESGVKMGGCAAGGALIGGCIAGPPGAVVGAEVGAAIPPAIDAAKALAGAAKAASDSLQPYVDKLKQAYPNLPPPGAQPDKPAGLGGSVSGNLPGGAPTDQKPGGVTLPPDLSDKPEASPDRTKSADPKGKPTTAGIPPDLVDISDIPVDTKTPLPPWFAGETGRGGGGGSPPYDPNKDPGMGGSTPGAIASSGQTGSNFSGGVPNTSTGGGSSGSGNPPVRPQDPAYKGQPGSGSPPTAGGGVTALGAPGAAQGTWCWSDQLQSYYQTPMYPCPPTKTTPQGSPPGSTLPGVVAGTGLIGVPPRTPPGSGPPTPGSQRPPGGGSTPGSPLGPMAKASPAPAQPPAQTPGSGAQDVDLSGTWYATYREPISGYNFHFTLTLSRVAAGKWQGPLDYVNVDRPDLSFKTQAMLQATGAGKVHLTYTAPEKMGGAQQADGTYTSSQMTFGGSPYNVTYTRK